MENVHYKKYLVTKSWNSNSCDGSWNSTKLMIFWRIQTERYVVKVLNKNMVYNKKVLDIGCGQGLEVALAKMKGAREVIGVDLSEKSIQLAKKRVDELRLKNIKFLVADAENLPFRDEHFDIVYSFGVFRHTPNTKKAVEETYRVLKKGGKAIIMLYRKNSPRGIVVTFIRTISKIIDLLLRKKYFIYKKLKKYYKKENFVGGTALLELFGCPILKTFSDSEIQNLFKNFSNVKIKHYSPGFVRFLEVLGIRNSYLREIFKKIDKKTEEKLGFYTLVIAKK